MLAPVSQFDSLEYGYIARHLSTGLYLSACKNNDGGIKFSLEPHFSKNCVFSVFEKEDFREQLFAWNLSWQRHYSDKRLNGTVRVAVAPNGQFFDLFACEYSDTPNVSCLVEEHDALLPDADLAEGLLFTLTEFSTLEIEKYGEFIQVVVRYHSDEFEDECVFRVEAQTDSVFGIEIEDVQRAFPGGILDEELSLESDASSPRI